MSVLTGMGFVLTFALINLLHFSGLYSSGKTSQLATTNVSPPVITMIAQPNIAQSTIGGTEPPSNLNEPTDGVVTTKSWMVLTDEFLDNLRSESFWAKRGGGSAGRSSKRTVKRSFLFGNVLENGVPPDRKTLSDGGRSNWDKNVNQDVASKFYSGNGNTYRTVCVRTCDGSYSPLSFSTTRSNFRRDERKCKKRNGRGGKLYVYRNPGETVEDMVDLRGKKYSRTPTAFLFRAVYKPNCKSKPHPWQIASLDRHKLYRMKAKIRSLRGRKRRQARIAMRQFKRSMKQRRINSERRVQLALSGETQGRVVRSNYTTTSASQMDITRQRVASLSPIRALTTAMPSNEHLAPVGLAVIARTNVIVVPDNDDNPIFLPERNPSYGGTRLAMRSTGSAAFSVVETTSAKLPASGPVRVSNTALRAAVPRPVVHTSGYVRSASAAEIIVPDNDDTPILLPTRNLYRNSVNIALNSDAPHEKKRDRHRRLARANRDSRMSLGVRKPREIQKPKPIVKVKTVKNPRRRIARKRARSWKAGIFASQR